MAGVTGENASLSDIAFQSEAEAILAALDTHNGHRARTAKALGISERTLRYRLASMRESGLMPNSASNTLPATTPALGGDA